MEKHTKRLIGGILIDRDVLERLDRIASKHGPRLRAHYVNVALRCWVEQEERKARGLTPPGDGGHPPG